MIYFLVPVFNEALNIAELAKNLLSVLPEYEKFYVFVDDCSTDSTREEIRNAFPSAKLHLIEKAHNGGPGHSFNLGMEWILSHSSAENDLLISLEGDNTSDLDLLPALVAATLQEYDVALASVYLPGGKLEKTNWFKKWVSGIANWSIRTAFNLNIHTLSSFYRVYRLGILRRVKSQYGILIAETGFVCMVELIVKLVETGAKVVEIPTVLHSGRRKGSSKMNIVRTTFGYLRFISRHLGRSR